MSSDTGGLTAPTTVTTVFLTGVIVTLGSWTRGKKVPIKVWVGVGVASILFSGLSAMNEALGRRLALVMLISALFIPIDGEPYIVSIVELMRGNKALPNWSASDGITAGGQPGQPGAAPSGPTNGQPGTTAQPSGPNSTTPGVAPDGGSFFRPGQGGR